MTKTIALSALLTVSLASTSLVAEESSDLAANTELDQDSTLALGVAHDSVSGRILPQSCVDTSALETNSPLSFSSAAFEMLEDASFEQLSKKLSLEASANLGLTDSIDLSLAGDYVRESASSSRSISRSFVSTATSRAQSLDLNTLNPDPRALAFLDRISNTNLDDQGIAERRRRFCGDSFLLASRYEAKLSATIALVFSSEESASTLGASLNLGSSDDADLDLTLVGGLNQLTEEEKGQIALKVTGVQLGGEPTGLLQFLPAGELNCNLSEPEPCIEAYHDVLNYARTNFVAQLATADASKLIPAATRWERYDNTWSLFELAPDAFMYF